MKSQLRVPSPLRCAQIFCYNSKHFTSSLSMHDQISNEKQVEEPPTAEKAAVCPCGGGGVFCESCDAAALAPSNFVDKMVKSRSRAVLTTVAGSYPQTFNGSFPAISKPSLKKKVCDMNLVILSPDFMNCTGISPTSVKIKCGTGNIRTSNNKRQFVLIQFRRDFR